MKTRTKKKLKEKKKHNKLKIYTLSAIIHLHDIIRIIIILFIIFYSFGIQNRIINITTIIVCISFIIFRKCVIIDIYNYIKGDIDEKTLPKYARDNYLQNSINNFFSKKKVEKTSRRLDIVQNLEPFVKTKCIKKTFQFFNSKIHYIGINIINIIILLTIYDMHKFIPVFMVWFFTIFPI